MRTCAWLSTAPERKNANGIPTPGKPRRETLGDSGVEPELPPCDARYLLDYLFEIGPLVSGGSGAIGHEAIAAWQHNTGIRLTAWEARAIRRLSGEYLDESVQARSATRPAPWEDAPYYKPEAYLKSIEMKQAMKRLDES